MNRENIMSKTKTSEQTTSVSPQNFSYKDNSDLQDQNGKLLRANLNYDEEPITPEDLAPDGGWGWVIFVAMVIVSVSEESIIKSSSDLSAMIKKFVFINEMTLKRLGGFQRLKTGTFLLFCCYISNEIFYSNSLPYKRYIFYKYFVKFLLIFFENSVIGTSSPVTLKKKVLSAYK